MATTAIANHANAPISQHRAFPAIVALWFAALLGFGTLVMPAILLERAVGITGLAAALPAANPPLGYTAHLMVAALAGCLGALLGFVIARRLAGAHSGVRPGQPIPLDVHEDLDEPFDFTDQPLADLETADLETADPEAANPDDPIEQFPTFAELERRRAQRRGPEQQDAPGSLDRRLFLRRSEDEPLVFTSPSLTRLSPDNENTLVDEPAEGEEALAQYLKPAAPQPQPEPVPTWQSEPLEHLGLVQLVERLGASLARRRAVTAAAPPPASPPQATDGFEIAPPEDAAEAMAAYFAVREPTGVATAADEAEDASENEGEFGSLLSLRQPAAPPVQTDDALRQALATLQRMSGTA